MEKLLLVAPIILPLATAIIVTVFWYKRQLQSFLNVIGSATLLLVGFLLVKKVSTHGIQAMQIGDWPAPFGITIVVDMLSALMVLFTGVIAFALAFYSMATIDRRRKQFGYYSLVNTLYMGVCGSFVTGDLFNMYVWFEVMLISSFVLLTLGGESKQLEGTMKYVTLNLISSALFLVGVGFLYGIAGTLNMADLAVKLMAYENKSMVTVVSMFFLAAFGIKAAVFPVFFWLPASYHTPPIAVTSILAGLLTKVGIYSLIRVFTLIFINNIPFTHTILLVISGFTMVVGVLGAASQYEIRRLLSMHIISQIGYMIMGLAIYTPLALSGALLHIIHNMVVKTNLFLISGVINRVRGSYHLKLLGGLSITYPMLAILFIISALSLAGLPPLSGFWSKFLLVKAGLQEHHYFIIIVSLIVSLLTLYSMTKIWNEAFWKNYNNHETVDQSSTQKLFSWPVNLMILPIIFLTALTILVGFYPEFVFHLVQVAGHQMMNPSEYIQVVLGGKL